MTSAMFGIIETWMGQLCGITCIDHAHRTNYYYYYYYYYCYCYCEQPA